MVSQMLGELKEIRKERYLLAQHLDHSDFFFSIFS